MVSASDRRPLAAVIGDRNSPQKHVWRAEIILLSADGDCTVEIMRRTGKAKNCVWCRQQRFAEQDFDGLLRDCQRRCKFPQKWRSKIPHFAIFTDQRTRSAITLAMQDAFGPVYQFLFRELKETRLR